MVDDENSLVDIGRAILTSLGYTVAATTDSLKALEMFLAAPRSFDLVITDQTMPHMTGFELAQKVIAVRPGLPVVLCTGFSETVSAEKAAAVGIREFLMKPFDLRRIAETVRRVLDQSSG